MSRAAYMREYRAKQKPEPVPGLDEARERIAVLEAEVARLKRELAARTIPFEYGAAAGFNTRPFTPVPKPGKRK